MIRYPHVSKDHECDENHEWSMFFNFFDRDASKMSKDAELPGSFHNVSKGDNRHVTSIIGEAFPGA